LVSREERLLQVVQSCSKEPEKNLRHVKLKEVEQLRDANLRQLILEAAALNEETPVSESMRIKRRADR